MEASPMTRRRREAALHRKEKRRRLIENAIKQTTESNAGRNSILSVLDDDDEPGDDQENMAVRPEAGGVQEARTKEPAVAWVPRAMVVGEDGTRFEESMELSSVSPREDPKGRRTSGESSLCVDSSLERVIRDAENHVDGEQPSTSWTVPDSVSPGVPSTPRSGAREAASRDLASYLPANLCDQYRGRGFAGRLYAWQAECLNTAGVLEGRSIVYSAPTSGGKTLVAEILMLRRVLEQKKQALLVLPFVALCDEKAAQLEPLCKSFGREVFRLYGRHKMGPTLPGLENAVVVCTIEKANVLVTALIEEGRLHERLCVVVVDEAHMVADRSRGPTLELMLTKIKHASLSNYGGDVQLGTQDRCQIVCMSATLPNVDQVANWLGARLYVCNDRPVPLVHRILVGDDLKDESLGFLRKVTPLGPGEGQGQGQGADPAQDKDLACALAWETVKDGHSVLIFCASKAMTQETARLVSRLLEVPASEAQRQEREAIAHELEQFSERHDLADLIRRGAAYHNADLSAEERQSVEQAFRGGACRVLAATSTLAAGVNLPARRVIFRYPYVWGQKTSSSGAAGGGRRRELLSPTRYRQMAGRAGRAGIDTYGEAVLVCPPDEKESNLAAVVGGKDTPITSSLLVPGKGGRGMRRPMLEAVCSGAVRSDEDVKYYIECTLMLHAAEDADEKSKAVNGTKEALRWLVEKAGYLRWNRQESVYEPTRKGMAVGLSGMSPEEGHELHADLKLAREGFVLSNDLHMLYLLTPISASALLRVSWQKYYNFCGSGGVVSESDKSVMRALGLTESFLCMKSQGRGSHSARHAEQERRARRFWGTLILRRLVDEVPVNQIAREFTSENYEVTVADIGRLQEESAYLASMNAVMCERMGWADMQALIEKFQARVSFGAREDVLSLAEIEGLKTFQARILYKSGLRTPEEVYQCSTQRIAQILSDNDVRARANPGRYLGMYAKIAKRVHSAARDLLSRRAEELLREAEALREIKPDTRSPPSQEERERRGLKEVSDAEGLEELRQRVNSCDRLAFCLHVQRQHEPDEKVLGLALCVEKGKAVYVPLSSRHRDDKEPLPDGFQISAWCLVREILASDDGKAKATWDLKYQLKLARAACRDRGLDFSYSSGVRGCHDLRLAAWLLKPDSYNFSDSASNRLLRTWGVLESLLSEHVGCNGAVYTQIGYGHNSNAIGTIPYACRNAACLFDLVVPLRSCLEQEDLLRCYDEIETPLVPVLAEMEGAGVPFNSAIYKEAIPQLKQRVDYLVQKAYEKASVVKTLQGDPKPFSFDLSSHSAVQHVLFEIHKLPPPPGSESSRRGGVRGFSTRKEVLEQLSSIHPLPGIILEYRQLSKLLNTMEGNLPEYERWTTTQSQVRVTNAEGEVVPVKMTRIKGTFLQTTSETGRVQMDEPNLQCVPNPREVKVKSQSQEGAEGRSARIEVNVRGAFQTLNENAILSADYAQLELRLMAHLSKDPVLLGSIQRGEDAFAEIASRWLGVPESEVTPEMRSKAKRLAYGLLYGMGIDRLAQQLGCGSEAARGQAEGFKRCLAGVEEWKKRVAASAERQGFVQTIGGRKRFFGELRGRRGRLTDDQRAACARQAVNTTCQGSASDIIKRAMVNIQGEIDRSPRLGGGRCRMILEVHDELLFEVRRTHLAEAARLVKREMEGAWRDLGVPLEVRLKAGGSWGTVMPYEPPPLDAAARLGYRK